MKEWRRRECVGVPLARPSRRRAAPGDRIQRDLVQVADAALASISDRRRSCERRHRAFSVALRHHPAASRDARSTPTMRPTPVRGGPRKQPRADYYDRIGDLRRMRPAAAARWRSARALSSDPELARRGLTKPKFDGDARRAGAPPERRRPAPTTPGGPQLLARLDAARRARRARLRRCSLRQRRVARGDVDALAAATRADRGVPLDARARQLARMASCTSRARRRSRRQAPHAGRARCARASNGAIARPRRPRMARRIHEAKSMAGRPRIRRHRGRLGSMPASSQPFHLRGIGVAAGAADAARPRRVSRSAFEAAATAQREQRRAPRHRVHRRGRFRPRLGRSPSSAQAQHRRRGGRAPP